MPTNIQRDRRQKTLYNLTEEDRQKIEEFQLRVCAISGVPPRGQRLAVDHCHKSGLIRGLLHWRMNRAIAMFNDDPKLLRAAADYLDSPPAVAALGEKRYGLIGKAKIKKKMVYGSQNGPVKVLERNERGIPITKYLRSGE